jgi:hypothetical protein
MIEIEELRAAGLHIDRFRLRAGEAWCCLGGTGSGMERFSAVLGGSETTCTARRLELPRDIGVISTRRNCAETTLTSSTGSTRAPRPAPFSPGWKNTTR